MKELSKDERRAEKARRRAILKRLKSSTMKSDRAQFYRNYLVNDYIKRKEDPSLKPKLKFPLSPQSIKKSNRIGNFASAFSYERGGLSSIIK